MNVLIVGTPRSGTTLVTCLVGSHPRCIAMSECYWGEENKIVSPRDVTVNKLCVPNHIQFKHPPLPAVLRRLVRHGRDFLARSLGRTVKDWPLGALSIQEYVREREARLLFVLRDPAQTIDSMVRRSGLSVERAASRWAHGVREMHRSHLEYESRTYIVQFSDVVARTEETLNEVCDFLDVAYDPAMTDGYERTPQYDRSGIEATVTERSVPSYGLEERFPEAYEMYRELQSR